MYLSMGAYVCMHGCMYVCIHRCMSVCMYVRMYVCMYMCVCKYVHMYVCTYVCMYVYVCVCVCIHTCLEASDRPKLGKQQERHNKHGGAQADIPPTLAGTPNVSSVVVVSISGSGFKSLRFTCGMSAMRDLKFVSIMYSSLLFVLFGRQWLFYWLLSCAVRWRSGSL